MIPSYWEDCKTFKGTEGVPYTEIEPERSKEITLALKIYPKVVWDLY